MYDTVEMPRNFKAVLNSCLKGKKGEERANGHKCQDIP